MIAATKIGLGTVRSVRMMACGRKFSRQILSRASASCFSANSSSRTVWSSASYTVSADVSKACGGVSKNCFIPSMSPYGTFDIPDQDESQFVAAMEVHPTKAAVPRIGEVLEF